MKHLLHKSYMILIGYFKPNEHLQTMSNLAQNFIYNTTNNLMLELNKPTMGPQCHNLFKEIVNCPIEPYDRKMLMYIVHIFIKWHPFLWPFSSSLGHLTLALHPSLKDPKTWTQSSTVELPKFWP